MVARYDKRGSSLPLVELAANNSADEVAIYVDGEMQIKGYIVGLRAWHHGVFAF